jgi:hypothetical protein
LVDLKAILQPPCDFGKGGYKDPKLDRLLPSRLEKMSMFLWNYIDTSEQPNGWMGASLKTAKAFQKGPLLAGRLREWTWAFVNDQDDLPLNIYGTWNMSILEDEDFRQELELHLQGIDKYVSAVDIVRYVDQPEVKARLKLTKTISLAMGQWWMKEMDYRWTKTPSGQFVDGHERANVVEYHQLVLLPIWAELLLRTRIFMTDGTEFLVPPSTARKIVVWNHDESTYYANDRQKIRWVLVTRTRKLYLMQREKGPR